MTAPELRSLIRTILDGLDDDQRTTITDSLLARATRGRAGWKPSRPSARVVDEVCAFADAARRVTHVEGVATLANPIGDMESVSAGALPDLGPFLPRWVTRLERVRPAKDDWASPPERWLREAVFRKEGIDGLEHLARKTKRPQACLAWCEALAERGDWPTALRAYDDAAKLVGKSPWRGELLDGAALAAQQLGRSDVAARLEAAWIGAPSMARLLRWLVAPSPQSLTLVIKAGRALKRCPKTDGRQLGLLRIVTGDLGGAAKLLAEAPGLGWSSADHPGHVLFPAFAILLADAGSQKIGPTLLASLESVCSDPLEMLRHSGLEGRPALGSLPFVRSLIEALHSTLAINPSDRDVMLDAMRLAAEGRIEGILGQSRRRHYGHAATLAAWCLAVAPRHRQKAASDWIAQLLGAHSRHHAFKAELHATMKSLGLTVPLRPA